MRAENSPRRKFWLATLLLLVVFVLVVNLTSVAINHPKYITFEPPAVNSVCTAADDPTTARTASLRLLVSFVYFETGGMKACEVSNKRINLATFLISAVSASTSDVQYVFTFPARKPGPSDILDSAGISPDSGFGKVIADALTSSGVQNIELLDADVEHPAADLCHHHAVIVDKKRKGQTFDYVLVLNDGVRGPFFDPRKMAEMEKRLPFENTPLWLVSLLTLMLMENSTRSVGPILSCEKDVHVQSWTQLFDWRVMDTILPTLHATCEPGIDWDSAIDKEVAIGVSILGEDFSLAGLHPGCRVLRQEDRVKLYQQDPETLKDLSWCKNVLRADASNFLDQLSTPDVYGFVKFGGTMWRDGLLSTHFVDQIHEETRRRFGISDMSGCYRQAKGRNT